MSNNYTEKQFEHQVRDLAKIYGWLYYHTWLSQHSAAGFPDLVLVRPPRLIFAELKSNKGKVLPAQQEWLDALEKCGIVISEEKKGKIAEVPEVYLWRPSQIEEIAEVLR